MAYTCGECGEDFPSANLRDSHSRKKCRKTYRLKFEDGTISIIRKCKDGFKCPISTCSAIVSRGDSLRNHYNGAHSKKHQEKTLRTDEEDFCITPDFSTTPEIFTNAGLCIVHHNDLLLLICLNCHFAIRNINAKSIKRHVKKHGDVKRYQSDLMIVVPPLDQLSTTLEQFSFTLADDVKLLKYTKNLTTEFLVPVPGIMISRGFFCKKCVFYCASPSTLSNHRGIHHRDSLINDVKGKCKVQVLFHGIGVKYYGVTDGDFYSTCDTDAQEIRELIMKGFLDDMESWQPECLTPPIEELTPWLRLSRWNELAKEFMPKEVSFLDVMAQMQPFTENMVTNDKMSFLYLERVVSIYLQKLQDLISKGVVEYRLLRKVMRKNPTDNTTNGLNQLYRETSTKRYCDLMTIFLLCLLRSSSEQTMLPYYVIRTNRNDLKDALYKLVIQLNTLTDDSVLDVDLSVIHQVVLLLWTPEKSTWLRAKKTSDCIFTRFLILSSLRKVGNDPQSTGYAFQHVSKTTQVFAILQYWARGVILMELAQELWHPHPTGLQDEKVEELCTYVMDYGLDTPFNTIAQYMRVASTIAMNTPIRANIAPTDDTETACSIDGQHITFDTFKDMVKAIMRETYAVLDQKVLLGLKSDWIDIHLRKKAPIYESINTTELYYSFVNDKRNKIFQDHKTDLVRHMFFSKMTGSLYVKGKSENGLIFNTDALQNWMLSASRLEELLVLLVHFTSGLPVRGQEYKSFLMRNTPTGDRAFFWYNEKVMIFQSYHKGANCGAPIKLNAHFLPKLFSPIFLKFFSMVRPMQAHVAKILWGEESQALYLDLWFVNMGKRLESEDLSKSIQNVFKKHCGVQFGLSSYRHLAAFFAEKLLRHHDQSLDDILDESGGHTSATVGHHYARSSTNKRELDSHRSRALECLSEMWHKKLDIYQPSETILPATPSIVLRPHPDVELDIGHVSKKTRIVFCPDAPLNSEGYNGTSFWERDPIRLINHDSTRRAVKALSRFEYKEWKSTEQATSVALSIENVHNFVAILPTGGGKSLIFMAPSTVTTKTVIVVVPLKALIQGHVAECQQAHITCAVYEDAEVEVEKAPAIVFVSIETAAQSREFLSFAELLKSNDQLHSIVFDEIHLLLCGFRPVVKKVLHLIMLDCQIIGLTASLHPKKQTNIEITFSSKMLWVRGPTIRPNIKYMVVEVKDIDKEILSRLRTWMSTTLLRERAIVYCLTCEEVELLAKKLTVNKFSCVYLHSKLQDSEKIKFLRAWEDGDSRILVATSVIGCGYNYKYVKLVLHKGDIRSIADYHQESGRCGRDGLPASSCIVTNSIFRRRKLVAEEKRVPTENSSAEDLKASLQDLKIAHQWIEDRSTCRRFRLHGEMDGKVQMCNLLKGAVPCDICSIGEMNHDTEMEEVANVEQETVTYDGNFARKAISQVHTEEEATIREDIPSNVSYMEGENCDRQMETETAAERTSMLPSNGNFMDKTSDGVRMEGALADQVTTVQVSIMQGMEGAQTEQVSVVRVPVMQATETTRADQVPTVHAPVMQERMSSSTQGQRSTSKTIEKQGELACAAREDNTTTKASRARPAILNLNMQYEVHSLQIVRQCAGDGSTCLLCKKHGPKGDVTHGNNLNCPHVQNACIKCLDTSHKRTNCCNKFGKSWDTCHVCHFQHRANWSMKIHKGNYGPQCSDKSGESLRLFIWKAWRDKNLQTKLWKEFPEIKGKSDKEFADWMPFVPPGRILNNFVRIAAEIVRIRFPEIR